jgi:hypothetical protein
MSEQNTIKLEQISLVIFIFDNFGSKAGEITEFRIMRQFQKDWMFNTLCYSPEHIILRCFPLT